MGQNDTEKTTSLTDRQLAALPHIAASPTLSQAARSASVGRATLYRWLQDERSSPRPPTSPSLSFRP